VIHRASWGFTGVGAKIFEFKPLVYTGKISYGIYVYHPFVYFLLPILFYRTDIDFFLLPRLLQFGLLVGTTIGMAAISWHFFESPINSLKNRLLMASRAHAARTSGPRLYTFRSQQSGNDFICQALMDHTKPMKREDLLHSDHHQRGIQFCSPHADGWLFLPDSNSKNFWLARASKCCQFSFNFMLRLDN
jgi:hypothetical protein